MSDALAIKRFIVAEFVPDVSPGDIDDDYDLLANGVIDSLGLLRVVDWLAQRFDVAVDDVEISEEQFTSVAAMCRFVDQNAVGRAVVAAQAQRGE
jgi:acyl carrier protein